MRKDLVDICRSRNAQTGGLADSYAGHRERVMQLITATVADLTGSPDGTCSSIVLLGPGNCLDVDLSKIAERFQSLHLVDLDEFATQAAIDASGVSAHKIQLHAPADISEPLLSLTSRDLRLAEENRQHCIDVLQSLSSEDGVVDVPESDVVVSLSVFTQMVEALSHIIPGDHPTFANAVKALRIGHLRRMLSMLREGGVAIFVTDVVSSDTAEELKSATDDSLNDLMKQLVNDQNFFTGTNPSVVLADLNVLSRLPSGPDTVHTIDPWLWHVGDRVFAVYAFRIQKRLPVETEQPVAE